MNSTNIKHIRPFASVLILIGSLLVIVIFQMEERRLGYTLIKLNRDHRKVLEEKRGLEIQLARVTKPQLLESLAQNRLTLKKLNADQIIHLSGPVRTNLKKREIN